VAQNPGTPATTAVLVPVKSFRIAKARLAPALDPAARARLARSMAEHVVLAAAPLPVAVVCDDPDVARWARTLGASVIDEPGKGLNGAVTAGVAHLRRAGIGEVVVAHGDLPWAKSFEQITGFDGITLVPDRHHDGTNVVCLPPGVDLVFSYGPGSFHRHLALATDSGAAVRVLRPPELTWDVDVPSDLSISAKERW